MCLVGLGISYASQAQDPATAGINPTSGTITTGSTTTIEVDILNGSSTSIPQSNSATWTINLPANIGYVSSTFDQDVSSFITTTVSPYSGGPSGTGTIITLVSDKGAFPGNGAYLFTITVIGVSPTTASSGAAMSVQASTTPPIGTNVPGNDQASSSITVTGAQPVALISFTAKALEDRTVQLDWVTSLETDNKGFVVERSKDLKSFEKVGEVGEIAPNSSAKKYYSLLDRTPFAGTSYYRLTQIDLSGKTTTYPAVSVVLREGAYGVFPNPVVKGQQFLLNLDEPETAVVNLFGADGRALPLQKAGVQSGAVLLRTTGTLSTGMYIVTVEERGQSRQHRIVVE